MFNGGSQTGRESAQEPAEESVTNPARRADSTTASAAAAASSTSASAQASTGDGVAGAGTGNHSSQVTNPLAAAARSGEGVSDADGKAGAPASVSGGGDGVDTQVSVNPLNDSPENGGDAGSDNTTPSAGTPVSSNNAGSPSNTTGLMNGAESSRYGRGICGCLGRLWRSLTPGQRWGACALGILALGAAAAGTTAAIEGNSHSGNQPVPSPSTHPGPSPSATPVPESASLEVTTNTTVPGGWWGQIDVKCTLPEGIDSAEIGMLEQPDVRIKGSATKGVTADDCAASFGAGSVFPDDDYPLTFKLLNGGKVLAEANGALTVGPYNQSVELSVSEQPPVRALSLNRPGPLILGSFKATNVPSLLVESGPRNLLVVQSVICSQIFGTNQSNIRLGPTIYIPPDRNQTTSACFPLNDSSTVSNQLNELSKTNVTFTQKDPVTGKINPAIGSNVSAYFPGKISIFAVGVERSTEIPVDTSGIAPWTLYHHGGPAPTPSASPTPTPTPTPKPSSSPRPQGHVGLTGPFGAAPGASGQYLYPATGMFVTGLEEGGNATLSAEIIADRPVTGDIRLAFGATNYSCTFAQPAPAGSSCEVEIPISAQNANATAQGLRYMADDNSGPNNGQLTLSVDADGYTARVTAPWNVTAAPPLTPPVLVGGPFNVTVGPGEPGRPFQSGNIVNASGTRQEMWVNACPIGKTSSFLISANGQSTGSAPGSHCAWLPKFSFPSGADLQTASKEVFLDGTLAPGEALTPYQIKIETQSTTKYRHSANSTAYGIVNVFDCPTISLKKAGSGVAVPGEYVPMCTGLEMVSNVPGAPFSVTANFNPNGNTIKCPAGWNSKPEACIAPESLTAEQTQAALREGMLGRRDFSVAGTALRFFADPTGNNTEECKPSDLQNVCIFSV